MDYFKLDIVGIPHIRFAHNYQSPARDYRITPLDEENTLELTYVHKGALVCTTPDGGRKVVPEGCINVHIGGRPVVFTCEDDFHSHSTVGIKMNFRMYSVSERHVMDCVREAPAVMASGGLRTIVPDYISDALLCEAYLEKYINKIIQIHSLNETYGALQCSGLCLDFLSEISRTCINGIFSRNDERLSPSALLYARKAMDYISAGLDRKLTVGQIASQLEISEGYLSGIFKSATGQTLIEYINRVKLARVRELVLTKNISLKQAGERVGIYDCGYLSRMFRKYYGISVSECRLQNNQTVEIRNNTNS
ncbi:MAG: helix-turn-helix transcriptional regulator [Eubacteriales bacterium]